MKAYIKILLFFLSYVFHRNRNSKVIYYHDLGTNYTDMGTDFDLFRKHINIVRKSGYQIVPTVFEKENQVMICFDDGWAGIYDHRNFFIENSIVPTIFIAVDLVGRKGYMTKTQIEELINMGFNFECHTWFHKSLTLYTSDNDLERELKDSRERLKEFFGLDFSAICYPQGKFSRHINDLCQEYGYQKQYSSISGGFYDMKECNIICRNCVQFSSPLEFTFILNSTSYIYRKKNLSQHFSD